MKRLTAAIGAILVWLLLLVSPMLHCQTATARYSCSQPKTNGLCGQWVAIIPPAPPTLTIGTVTTLPAGSQATASITGTAPNWVLNLGIPVGATGQAATIAVGTVSALPPGSTPMVTNVGSSSAAIFNFALTTGNSGTDGVTPVISVGATTTLPAGSPATVTMGGSPTSPIFSFAIPQGNTGPDISGLTSDGNGGIVVTSNISAGGSLSLGTAPYAACVPKVPYMSCTAAIPAGATQ